VVLRLRGVVGADTGLPQRSGDEVPDRLRVVARDVGKALEVPLEGADEE
jgi:hypothetical protein